MQDLYTWLPNIVLELLQVDIASWDIVIYLQFYFTSGRPAPNELTEDFLSKANQFFLSRSDGVQIKGEVEL